MPVSSLALGLLRSEDGRAVRFGDYRALAVDQLGGVFLAEYHRRRLQRIEAKLDRLLQLLDPETEATP